jgi:hypothetical protein
MNLGASIDKGKGKKECPRIEPESSDAFLDLKLPISLT